MPPKSRPAKRQKLAEGRAWTRMVSAVVMRDCGRCHICGHWNAKSADHLVPDTEGGLPALDNLKAAHGVRNPCFDCSEAAGRPIHCNQIRGAMSVERARRLIADRTGLQIPAGDAGPSGGREGRDW